MNTEFYSVPVKITLAGGVTLPPEACHQLFSRSRYSPASLPRKSLTVPLCTVRTVHVAPFTLTLFTPHPPTLTPHPLHPLHPHRSRG